MTSRPTVLASAVLTLAMLGDSLLYAVLPLHAATFGISLAWVGVLLSANRFVRLFAYGALARVAGHAGLRRFTIAAAMLGAASTFGFATGSGAFPLLVARLAWGLAFGSLSLATLAYATDTPIGAGARVGLSLSVRELGPITALTAGLLLVTTYGVRPALAIAGSVSLMAVPLALLLPRTLATSPQPIVRENARAWRSRHITASATIGLVADGVFPATIALLLAQSEGVGGAAIGAGALLAGKRVAVVLLAPIGGRLADRVGARAVTVGGVMLVGCGAALIACGVILAASLLLICGAAVTSTAIPLDATANEGHSRLTTLARLATARDAGAAAGPLLAIAVFSAIGGAILYASAALCVLGVTLWCVFASSGALSRLPEDSTAAL